MRTWLKSQGVGLVASHPCTRQTSHAVRLWLKAVEDTNMPSIEVTALVCHLCEPFKAARVAANQ